MSYDDCSLQQITARLLFGPGITVHMRPKTIKVSWTIGFCGNAKFISRLSCKFYCMHRLNMQFAMYATHQCGTFEQDRIRIRPRSGSCFCSLFRPWPCTQTHFFGQDNQSTNLRTINQRVCRVTVDLTPIAIALFLLLIPGFHDQSLG